MDKRVIIRNLDRHQKWLLKQQDETRPNGRRAESLMVACFEVLHECGRPKQSRDAWIDRFRFRRVLRRIQERYARPDGRRALDRLVDLAISELEACSWKKCFSVGALPIDREPRPATDAQRAAMAKARAAKQQAREDRSKTRKLRIYREAGLKYPVSVSAGKNVRKPLGLRGVFSPIRQLDQLAEMRPVLS